MVAAGTIETAAVVVVTMGVVAAVVDTVAAADVAVEAAVVDLEDVVAAEEVVEVADKNDNGKTEWRILTDATIQVNVMWMLLSLNWKKPIIQYRSNTAAWRTLMIDDEVSAIFEITVTFII